MALLNDMEEHVGFFACEWGIPDFVGEQQFGPDDYAVGKIW